MRKLLEHRKKQLFRLMVAVWDNNLEAIQRIIEKDIALVDEDIPYEMVGRPIKTILGYALALSHTDVARLLVESGAKIDAETRRLIKQFFPGLSDLLQL